MLLRKFLTILLPIALSGCVSFVPPSYQKPPAGASVPERHKVYEQYFTSYDTWSAFKIGGERYAGGPENYIIANGDTLSADRAKKSKVYGWVGLAIGLTGITAALFDLGERTGGKNRIDARYFGIAFGGLGLQLIIVKFGQERHLKPASEAFNDYLRTDLDLPME